MKIRFWVIGASLAFLASASLPAVAQESEGSRAKGSQDRPQIQPPRPSPGKPQPPRPPKPQPPRPQPPRPPRPPVVVRDSLSLYSSTSWRGSSVRLTNSATSLGMFGFDNRAQSLRVVGHWQVCDRPRYRGVCRTVTGSQSNLARVGLSGRISSVRYLGR